MEMFATIIVILAGWLWLDLLLGRARDRLLRFGLERWAAALERDIAMIEDGKLPPFLEQDGRKGGE